MERQHHNNRRNWNPRRNSERSLDDEPEWFTEGPTSRLDTIELKGFEGKSSFSWDCVTILGSLGDYYLGSKFQFPMLHVLGRHKGSSTCSNFPLKVIAFGMICIPRVLLD